MLQEQGTFHSCGVTDRQTGKDSGRKRPRGQPAGGQGEARRSGAYGSAGGQIVPCQATRQHFQDPGPWLPLKKGSDAPTKTCCPPPTGSIVGALGTTPLSPPAGPRAKHFSPPRRGSPSSWRIYIPRPQGSRSCFNTIPFPACACGRVSCGWCECCRDYNLTRRHHSSQLSAAPMALAGQPSPGSPSPSVQPPL